MIDALAEAYGPQKWWPAQTAFEMVAGAYLTQNTSWKAVEKSIENLAQAGALSPEGLRSISLEELQRLIRPSGFASRKAPALKAFVAMLDREFSGSFDLLAATPTAPLRRRLLALPGVGPETADAILLYALHRPVPVADEYLRRIAVRHGLLSPPPRRDLRGYEALASLMRSAYSELPAEHLALRFNEAHALVVAVGKSHCRKQPQCGGCPLAADLALHSGDAPLQPSATKV